jgi:Tol biopolymer transport system component
VLLAAVALALPACQGPRPAAGRAAAPAVEPYAAFGAPQRVAIRHYGGEAMEPFITRDGRWLLFNNRNDPRVDTNLHIALRVDDLTFDYRGDLRGANSAALDGVPSTDRDGRLFFVSTRSHAAPGSTLFRARLVETSVSGVEVVAGMSLRKPGMVTFDAEVSADGSLLFVADGEFGEWPVPRTADLAIAARDGDGFRRLPAGARLLQNINTPALEYAPAVSADLLELFFTRAAAADGQVPVILRAVRPRADAAFEPPQPVAAITGFAEAPALSPDGRSLYYHRQEGGRYVIYRVAR